MLGCHCHDFCAVIDLKHFGLDGREPAQSKMMRELFMSEEPGEWLSFRADCRSLEIVSMRVACLFSMTWLSPVTS
jgi:hypothetical protein